MVERPTLELYAEPGYGSYERARLRIGLQENDLWGTGKRLGVESIVGPLAQRVKIDLIDPWFLDTDMIGGLFVSGNHREEPSFTLDELSAGLNLTRRWNERIGTTLGYQFRKTELDDVDVITSEVAELIDDVDISSIAVTINRDTTRQLFSPTRGTRSRVRLEWASRLLGSEIDFLSTGLFHARYHALGERTVLALAARTGLIVPLESGEEIPLQLRRFNGGENTVRSFREHELGPTDSDGEPTGGETFTVLSVELRRHLAGRFSGALFVDVGNVDEDAEEYLSFRDLRSGVGLGLRYLLPIGHVRLDAAVNPDAEDDEDDVVVHLSIGMAF